MTEAKPLPKLEAIEFESPNNGWMFLAIVAKGDEDLTNEQAAEVIRRVEAFDHRAPAPQVLAGEAVKRYAPGQNTGHEEDAGMDERPDGDYVLYTDHVAQMQAKAAASVDLGKANDTTCPGCNAVEVESSGPRTTYACGGSDYDRRPGSFNACAKSADLDPKLFWFVHQMQAQLDRNANRGDWTDVGDRDAEAGIYRNLKEVMAVYPHPLVHAVDIANFAAMLAVRTPEALALLTTSEKKENGE